MTFLGDYVSQIFERITFCRLFCNPVVNEVQSGSRLVLMKRVTRPEKCVWDRIRNIRILEGQILFKDFHFMQVIY